MKSNIIILLTVFTFVVSACEKENTIQFTDTPILEAYLKPGDYLNLKISRQIPFVSDIVYSADDINKLEITVTSGNKTEVLQALGCGLYIDSNLIVTERASYELRFMFNGKQVYAYTYVPGKPANFTQSATSISIPRMDSTSSPPTGGFSMPEPVALTWDNPDKSYYIVVIENMETSLDAIHDFGDNEAPKNMFREAPTTSAGIEIRSMQFQYYGKHRLILYHVLPDYASLYKENSNSSQNLTNPSTSISNGYGIFTGLNTDTLYLNVVESK
ncbi:MAG: hypothetical protein HXX18_00315 [Bacteroidetes bacterium]|nr:hypothetical protein [Bacteroidota bacterium]